jgi:hypothetical protein
MKAAWISLAMIVACGAWPLSPTPPIEHTKLTTKHVDAKQTPPVEFPTTQQITDAVANGIERADEKHEASHPPTPPDKSGHFFNSLLVIFTGLLVAVGIGQGFLFFFTLKATEKAANAAALSANAAMGVARGSLILTHLDFADMGTASFDAKLQCPKIAVQFVNYGQTFAIPKIQCLEIVCTDVLPKDAAYDNIVRLPFTGLALDKNAGYELAHTKRHMFSLDEIEAINAGKKFLWVYGFIFYEDFLGKHHERRFCQRLYITESGYVFAGDENNTPKTYTESY